MATKYHIPDQSGTPRSVLERNGEDAIELTMHNTNHRDNKDGDAGGIVPSVRVRVHPAPTHDDEDGHSLSSENHRHAEQHKHPHHRHQISAPNTLATTMMKHHPSVSAASRRASVMLQPPTLLNPSELARLRPNGVSDPNDAPPGFMRPSSAWQVAWSYLVIIISVWNCVTIPYRMAFWPSPVVLEPDVIAGLVLDAIGDCCFFFEIYRALCTGYVDNGAIIYDKSLIWNRYARSWFMLDLITCLPTDIFQLVTMEVIPVIRVAKILRLGRVLQTLQTLEESSTTVSLQFRLGKLLFYTSILSHFAACIKYHVILADHAGNAIHDEVLEKPPIGRYLQAMYWAVGAMTGRDDTNPPENLEDAGFTVAMMVIGILWLAYIIASLETFAHDGSNSSARFQAKLGYVTQFMHQFDLPKEIQDKVKAYYSYLWSSTLRFDADHFLSTLPTTLQADVILSLHRVVADANIFEGCESGFLSYLTKSLTTLVSIPGEIICQVDMSGSEMWFISEGEVDICIGPKMASIARLRPGDHFGEYAILADDAHSQRTSTARSVDYCTLIVLAGDGLLKGLELFPASETLVRRFVDDHRSKTRLQERTFLGLDKQGKGNDKLKKLIVVEEQVQSSIETVWTISPTSRWYEAWQCAYFLVMLWNGISLPIRIGFVAHSTAPFILVFDYLGDAFLIADIVLNFRLRYVQGGSEVKDTKLIRHRYMAGWFLPHLLASMPLDFVMIGIGMQPLYRLNRIIRLAHVHQQVLQKLKDATQSEILSLIYLIFNFLFISHWASSIYYSFTTFEGFEPDWTYGPLIGHPKFDGWRPASVHDGGTLIYQYLQSQYFAMALLAGIGRHLYPPSNYDVCLSLFIMLTGVFVVSYLIGSVGHLIFHLNASASEFKSEAAFVSQLLDYRKVSPDVSQRVTGYMRHIWSSQKGIDPNVAVGGLPRQLRTDIMMYLFEDMIRKVPRFKDLDDTFVRQLVSELTWIELPAGEFVFRQGELGQSMYFISQGLVEIIFDTPTAVAPIGATGGRIKSESFVSDGGTATGTRTATPPSPASPPPVSQSHQLKMIGPGSFFGEGALFAGTRSASIRSHTPVRLLSLSEQSFQRVMHVHPHFAEKIMYLNEQRQKAIQQRKEHVAGVAQWEQHSQQQHSRSSSSTGVRPLVGVGHHHLRDRSVGGTASFPAVVVTPPAKALSAGRARRQPRPSIMATGLATKVERLLQQEKEREESRGGGGGGGRSLPRGRSGVHSVGMTASAHATASSSTGSGSSAAATAHTTHALPPLSSSPATTSNSAPTQWNPVHPPTLTITTTHTIALHDQSAHHHDIGVGGGHVSAGATTRVVSDIEFNRGVAAGAATIATPVAVPNSSSSPPPASPSVAIPDQERNVHAGIPPGFNMTDSPIATNHTLASRPHGESSIVLLNPTRTSSHSNTQTNSSSKAQSLPSTAHSSNPPSVSHPASPSGDLPSPALIEPPTPGPHEFRGIAATAHTNEAANDLTPDNNHNYDTPATQG